MFYGMTGSLCYQAIIEIGLEMFTFCRVNLPQHILSTTLIMILEISKQ